MEANQKVVELEPEDVRSVDQLGYARLTQGDLKTGTDACSVIELLGPMTQRARFVGEIPASTAVCARTKAYPRSRPRRIRISPAAADFCKAADWRES